jgi:hypothetical protein
VLPVLTILWLAVAVVVVTGLVVVVALVVLELGLV